MRIIVTGGRNYPCRGRVWNELDKLDRQLRQNGDRIATVIHGDCKTGADRFAAEWCEAMDIDQIAIPADWSLGKKAGPMRNTLLLNYGAEICLSFTGGRGTKDMTNKARKAGLKIVEVL